MLFSIIDYVLVYTGNNNKRKKGFDQSPEDRPTNLNHTFQSSEISSFRWIYHALHIIYNAI